MRYLEKRFLISGIYLLFMASTAFATNRYVSLDGTNDTAGGFINWVGAATNIQSAVNAATALDTVYVSNGVYSLSAPVTSAVSFSIIGTGGVVTVDGNNLVPCFVFADKKTNNLSNLTITKGYNSSTNSGNGGGVWLANGTISDCVFSNNVSTNHGGGLYFYYEANGVIQGCTFYGNSSRRGNGGGLYLYTVKTVVVDNCSFRSNVVHIGFGGGGGGGGAIKVEAGTRILITNSVFEFNVCTGQVSAGAVYATPGTYITHCTFNSNSVLYYGVGGAIRMTGGTVSNCFFSNNVSLSPGGNAGTINMLGGEVKNCVIANSRAEAYGGGMVLQSTWKVENCIIERNRSVSYGGGLEIITGDTNSYIRNCLIRDNISQGSGGGGISIGVGSVLGTISGCTVVSNKAYTYGGGLYNQNTATANQALMENCIIYYNAGAGNSSNYYLATNSMYFTNCLVAPAPTDYQTNCFINVQTNSPQFVDWLSGNYRLAISSPCINSGVNRDWMTGTLDLDGQRRIDRFSGLADLGCYENIPNGTMLTIP